MLTVWKLIIVYNWLYPFSVAFSKTSILVFLLGIFPLKVFKRSAYLLMLVIWCWCIANVLVITFQCKPIRFAWDKSLAGGSCISVLAFVRWSCVPNILTDVALLVLPLPYVWNLHVSTNDKIGLSTVFLTGSA